VKLYGIDGWLQWDTCNLEGLPPERLPGGITSMGKIPKGQYDNLPKLFTAKRISENGSIVTGPGGQFFIQYIHTLKPASYIPQGDIQI
jgi:hypothetical protein